MRREKLTSYHIQYVYSKQKIHESLIELVHLAKKQVLVISFFADKDWDFLNSCDRLINKGVEVRFVTKHGIITRRDLNNLAGVKISFVEEFLFGIAIVDQKYLLLNIDNGTGLENLALFTKDKLFINNLTNYFNDVFDQKHDPYGL